MASAIMIEITRKSLRGGTETTRTLWCLGDKAIDFHAAQRYCRQLRDVSAWSVEIVEQKPDLPPSKW